VRTRRTQVQAALAEVEGYHAVAGSLQSKQLLGEARGNLSKMNHISHVRCAAHGVQTHSTQACWCRHLELEQAVSGCTPVLRRACQTLHPANCNAQPIGTRSADKISVHGNVALTNQLRSCSLQGGGAGHSGRCLRLLLRVGHHRRLHAGTAGAGMLRHRSPILQCVPSGLRPRSMTDST